MSATPRDALSKFKRSAGVGAASSSKPPTSAEPAAAVVPKPTRIRQTVDLDPDQHRRLRMFALDRRTDGSAIIRALLEELDLDPDLADRVINRIKEGKQP